MDIISIIRENTLVYLHEDKMLTALADITKEATVDLKPELDSLLEQGLLYLDEEGRISISEDRGFFPAKLSLNKKGYGFAEAEGKPDVFIPAFAINGAFDKDDVLIEITAEKSDKELEGKVVKILKRNTTKVVGTYIVGKSKNVVFPDDERLPQIRINKDMSGGARNNEKVWVELDMNSIGENIMHGRIIEVLGVKNTPKAEQVSIIRSFNLLDKFEDDTLAQAKAINQNVDINHFKDRRDFTSHKVITIDGEDARDFDDALSLERKSDGSGYVLYVHIADVSHYVTENSPLDKEALTRGTSVYFSNHVIPMLPQELSNGVCSLQEGKYRLTLSCVMDLDKECNVLSSEIVEGIIKSSHRMTYTEIKNILAGDELLLEKYEDVYQDILDYRTIAAKLAEKRLKRGEIRFNIPEPFILENAEGEIVSIENRVQDEAHEIIESLMILTNECVAEKFNKLNIPFVYRVHEKPDEMKVGNLSRILKCLGIANDLTHDGDQPMSYQKIIDRIKGTPKENILSKLMLRSMMKAKYYQVNLGHFGIASEYYCHFTSPIRRYPDLMIHRIIKRYLKGDALTDLKIKFKPLVEKVSAQSSATERNADMAERAVDDYKKAVYMQKFLGETFVGTISGVQEYGVFVELDNGVEGLLRLEDLPMDTYTYDETKLTLSGTKNNFQIGDEIKVIVSNVNLKLRQIDFACADTEHTLKDFVKKGKSTLAGSKKSAKTHSSTHQSRQKSRQTGRANASHSRSKKSANQRSKKSTRTNKSSHSRKK